MGLYRRGRVWWAKFDYVGKTYKFNTKETSRGRAYGVEVAERVRLIDQTRRRPKRALPVRSLPKDTPFGELADRYVVDVILSRPRKPDGKVVEWIQVYLASIERLVAYFGRSTSCRHVAQRQVVAQYSHMLTKAISVKTSDYYLAILKAILFKGFDWGVIDEPPYIRLYNRSRQVNRFISVSEENRILSHCTPMVADFVCFLLDTGARKSEAFGLRWGDVRLNREPKPCVTFLHTKNKYPRSVPLPQRSADILRRLAAANPPPEQLVFCERARRKIMTVNGDVFANRGDIVPISNVEDIWRKAKIQAGLSEVRLHDLRHTYASRLLAGGAPLFTVARLLGHRTLAMTMRYAHLATEGLDDAVSLLDDA